MPNISKSHKIHIHKSEETIKKEQEKQKIEKIKDTANPTNKEIRDLLLLILDRLESGGGCECQPYKK